MWKTDKILECFHIPRQISKLKQNNLIYLIRNNFQDNNNYSIEQSYLFEKQGFFQSYQQKNSRVYRFLKLCYKILLTIAQRSAKGLKTGQTGALKISISPKAFVHIFPVVFLLHPPFVTNPELNNKCFLRFLYQIF